jgi:hypothetical protein
MLVFQGRNLSPTPQFTLTTTEAQQISFAKVRHYKHRQYPAFVYVGSSQHFGCIVSLLRQVMDATAADALRLPVLF